MYFCGGVGVGMIVIASLATIYYNMILAWSLYYMFASWQSQVPWYDCKNSWNTPCKSSWYLLFISSQLESSII